MSKVNHLQIDNADFQRQMKELGIKFEILGSKDIDRAQASALNKGAQRVRTQSVRQASKALSIQQKLLRPRVQIRRANANKQVATVWAGMQGVPLIKLRAKEVSGGVVAGPYLVPDGFIATTRSQAKTPDKNRSQPGSGLIGKTHVFKRKGRARYPLEAKSVNIRTELDPAVRNSAATYMRNEHRAILLQEYKFRVLKKAGIK